MLTQDMHRSDWAMEGHSPQESARGCQAPGIGSSGPERPGFMSARMITADSLLGAGAKEVIDESNDICVTDSIE